MKTLGFVLISVLLASSSAFAVGTSSSGSSSGASSGSSKSSSEPVTAADWYNTGYRLSQSDKYTEAVLDFKKAISINANYAEAYNMLGYCTRKLGNVQEAFGYYDKALSLKPNFPEAREYYGEAYLQSGDLTKAVQQYVILQKAGNKNAKELLEKIDEYVNK